MGGSLAKRVLLIGWDAADWQMAQPLLDQGHLPTLSRLIEGGVRGNLATIQPVISPMLWNSIATGKRADKHGIAGFVEPKPDLSGIRPVSSTSRKCKAIWNILNQVGLKSNVVSWFASHPAEPINGSIVSDRYQASIKQAERVKRFPDGTFHPAALEETLSPLVVSPADIPADSLLPFVPRAAQIDQERDDRLLKLAGLLAQTSTVHAAACHLVQQDDWDFTAIYYSAIDHFGHLFMPYHPPRMDGIAAADAAIYQDVMNGCYRFHDMMLDSLLAYAGPETTVILVSDHGFHSEARRPSTNACEQPVQWHREFGMACIQGPNIRQGDSLYGATLLDVTPTILSLFGLPIGKDMDGRPWLEVFEDPAPVKRIESWESVPGDAGLHPPGLEGDPLDEAESIRQLIDLGYIEAPSADTETTIRKVLTDRKTNLAIALSTSRRAARAIELWEELVAEHPEQSGYKMQLASCYLGLGELERAKRILGEIPTPDGNSAFVRLMSATIAAKDNQPEAALRIVRDVRREQSRDPAVLNRLGELLTDLESWDEAEEVLQASLGLLSDNPVALNGLARISLQKERYDQALEYALTTVGLVHFYPAAHFHLGSALFYLGREEEAIAAFETCLGMGFRPGEAHSHLAALYRRRDPRKANEHQRRMASY